MNFQKMRPFGSELVSKMKSNITTISRRIVSRYKAHPGICIAGCVALIVWIVCFKMSSMYEAFNNQIDNNNNKNNNTNNNNVNINTDLTSPTEKPNVALMLEKIKLLQQHKQQQQPTN